MSLDPMQVDCNHCGSTFVATPKRTFLGFLRFTCQNCEGKILYPLTPGFRVTYWVIAALMLVFIISAFSSGGYAYPGGVGLAVLFAIYRDWTLRGRIISPHPPHNQSLPIPTSTTKPLSRNRCATCEYMAPPNMKFCPECGTKLGLASSVSEDLVAHHTAPTTVEQPGPSGAVSAQPKQSKRPAAVLYARSQGGLVNRARLLSLCQRLRTGDLAYDQYELLAKAVGASIRREGIFGGKYIVTQGYNMVSFNNVPSLKPWFIENVLPAIEAKA